jgi:hypothetical protein
MNAKVFNYGTAPVYRIEKLLAEQPQQHMKLRYTYSLKNSLQCAQTINNMSFETNRKMMSLNITDLYTNIPIREVTNIKSTLEGSALSSNIQDELIMLVKTTMTQNYFEIDNSFWQQHEGTPMGSPISSMLAEIFLQHL